MILFGLRLVSQGVAADSCLPKTLGPPTYLKYVERIEGMNCITKNKQVIPISKKYKNDFIEKIVRQM